MLAAKRPTKLEAALHSGLFVNSLFLCFLNVKNKFVIKDIIFILSTTFFLLRPLSEVHVNFRRSQSALSTSLKVLIYK